MNRSDASTTTLGRTGIEVRPLAFGTMNLGRLVSSVDAHRMLDICVDAGVKLVNTADPDYSGEADRIVGSFIARRPGVDLVICAELSGPDMRVPYRPDLSRRAIQRAAEGCLQRLGIDCIDFLVVPRPNGAIPIDETLGALTDLVRAGKARYVATSTFPAWRVAQAVEVATQRGLSRPVMEVLPYNLLDRRAENEMLPMAEEYGLAVLAWAALGQGVLAGRYPSALPAEYPEDSRAARLGGIYGERVTASGVDAAVRLGGLAQELGFTSAQLAYLWVRQNPRVSAPLIGPRTPDQLSEIIAVLDSTVDESVLEACDAINPPGSVITDFFNSAPWMRMTT